ncbi:MULTISPECIES: FAD-dependent monooxygenase [unclassified Devosia]|uniref:FAD-dependent monooxygenase n=1 Tax=unclassified Devosia TaxID=196773 RepID=UPI0015543472|nr:MULTISPECIES: FAD-dependent monooxygenase [unclassified Devosia]
MPASGRTFFIAGAGIGGLTLALALAKFGAHVVILERSPRLSEFGAGLQISPNARRVLDRLGVGELINARGFEPAGIDVYPFGRPDPLVTMELAPLMLERFGAAYTVMHRADLAETLYEASRRFANIDVMFGVGNWNAQTTKAGVSLTIEEADGQNRTLRGAALIGADGVHSRTRTQLLGGPAATYSGRIAWRTLLPLDALHGQIALDRVSVLFGPHLHLVCYPLPHRNLVNLALFTEHRDDKTAQHPTLAFKPSRSPRLRAILDLAGDQWTAWPLYTVSTDTWHRGPIALLGDAAHAMVPFQAQGAAMAIEDAASLAPLLIETNDPAEAFMRYAALRQPRVKRVAKLSRKNGRIFHLPWPFSSARNLGITLQGRRGHLRRLAWLYGFDTDAPQPRPR